MATEPKKAPDDWISKKQAAEILGVNPRQIEKRAEKGWIDKRYPPRRPHETHARVEYRRADVHAIRDGKPNHCEALELIPKPSSNGTADLARIRENVLPGATRAAQELLGLMAPVFRMLQVTHRPPRAWLTLEEAVEYSGLPSPFLAELLRSSQVDNIGRGPKTWRVRRASLDAYGEPKS